jgi:NADH-quinone oxidoreductase subunit L
VVVAWGTPIWDAEASILEGQLHHAQHPSVVAEFGEKVREEQHAAEVSETAGGEIAQTVQAYADQNHHLAGNLALGIVALAVVFAALLYWPRFQRLDPAEVKEQYPWQGIHRFLSNKWYFDELYSAILVRPALAVAGWCRAFDTKVIDGTVDASARAAVNVSWWSGRFDLGIVDGLVNLFADVCYWIGGRLRRVQTGYLRSYVLFLVLAAVGIFAALTYLVAVAAAG